MTSLSSSAFAQRLDACAASVETLLTRHLDDVALEGEVARPPRLLAAMRHGCLGGGKRLRPFLVVESATLFRVAPHSALMVGAALECIHGYSLIHDDLPAMDNAELRRGRAAAHKAFDEATAILAGDALLTLAFDIVSRDEVHPDPAIRIALVSALARAAGLGGMVGGQMLDLEGEGRFGEAAAPDIALLQSMKTGALLRFACNAGAILGNAAPQHKSALDAYGRALGEAFQIADDLLDLEGDAATLGKNTGRDAVAGKSTFVALLGVEGARRRLHDRVAQADAALQPFGDTATVLRAAARFIAARKS